MMLGQVAVKLLPSVTSRNQEESSSNSSKLHEWCEHYLSLEHMRTAELLGCTFTDDNMALISVWYPNGNIANFLKVAPDVQRTPLVSSLHDDFVISDRSHSPPPYSSVK